MVYGRLRVDHQSNALRRLYFPPPGICHPAISRKENFTFTAGINTGGNGTTRYVLCNVHYTLLPARAWLECDPDLVGGTGGKATPGRG